MGAIMGAAGTACRPVLAPAPAAPGAAAPPSALLGRFADDYGGRYTITPDRFTHGERRAYRIVEWHAAEQFLVARNPGGDPEHAGSWTRIDWLPFTDQGPFTWGYCFTVYDAPTREAALAAPPADRRSPRSGCNGFPFSRMRRVPDGGGA